jgi:putative heme-binding domain-containing protein
MNPRHHCLLVSLLIDALLLVNPVASRGQNANPFEGDSTAIRAGAAVYSNLCTECHGPDAKGRTGPDLTLLWAEGGNDARAFDIVKNGVTDSVMPPTIATDNEIWAVVAYLRSISTVPPYAVENGNARRGERLFADRCSACHRVSGEGGTIGPDLSMIAGVRSKEMLTRSILQPSETIAEGFRTIRVLTRQGEEILGTLRGEDAYSVQLVDTNARLRGFLKSDLALLEHPDESLMELHGKEQLPTERELQHLLAYLASLRESDRKRNGSSQ